MNKKEFAIALWGSEKIPQRKVDAYYDDYMSSSLPFAQWKKLLKSRG